MTTIPKLDVVFLDTGLYATEGFTSGLLIFLKNTLKKFSSQGLNVGILSCVNQNNALPQSKHEGLRVRDDNGISVFEIIMNDQDSSNDDIVIKNYNYLLEATKPQIIIMNTPAVFLDHKDILIRELAQKTGKQVIHVLADELFPTIDKHDPTLVKKLYSILSQGEVIGVTPRIRDVFKTASGITAHPFKTVINTNSIQFPTTERTPDYIGMVNIHPLKGIDIFNAVASRMPEHKFLVIKNWPDVPEYIPSSSNVEIWDFRSKPADFYKRLKLLLIPSLMQEGPTMVIMEALYNGIPVIANRIGSIPEAGEDAATFINPPIIKHYQMEGTILYPVCDSISFERTCTEYCDAINRVLSLHTPQEERRLKAIAENDIQKGHDVMQALMNRWISNIKPPEV